MKFKIGTKVFATNNPTYGLQEMTISSILEDDLIICTHPKSIQKAFNRKHLIISNSHKGKLRKNKIKELNSSYKKVNKLLNELFSIDDEQII
jgi:hypothetical protein